MKTTAIENFDVYIATTLIVMIFPCPHCGNRITYEGDGSNDPENCSNCNTSFYFTTPHDGSQLFWSKPDTQKSRKNKRQKGLKTPDKISIGQKWQSRDTGKVYTVLTQEETNSSESPLWVLGDDDGKPMFLPLTRVGIYKSFHFFGWADGHTPIETPSHSD